uniref:non-specific serine/threonine protein kinase n=1 Tax=Wollemia nobilis TaxID=56998 RepID=A0A0C9S3V1_9CONI
MDGPSNVLLLFIALLSFRSTLEETDSNEVTTLRLLQSQWKGLTWTGVDPCGSKWVGVTCKGSHVADLLLSTMGLQGGLPSEIDQLTGLQRLDLSYNQGLNGPIPSSLGNLKSLRELVLSGCNFNGRIPAELGNLQHLTILDVSSNKLGGEIPPELGNLLNIYLFDIANNQLTGTLPPQLKNLVTAGHLVLDQNRLTGQIPSTVGLLKKLTVLRLDSNELDGPLPNISNLKNLGDMHVSNNKLTGSIPDLSGLTNLQYLDLSNNSFDVSNFPDWFSSLELVTTIMMEHVNLTGPFPSNALNLPQLEAMKLAKNSINGIPSTDIQVSPTLQLLDLEDNELADNKIVEAFVEKLPPNVTVKLMGNPACAEGSSLSNDVPSPCNPAQNIPPYVTPMKDCGKDIKCKKHMQVDPRICKCAMPFEGMFVFRAPSFHNLDNASRFRSLEESLLQNLNLTDGSIYILCCMSFDTDNYLNINVRIFPPPGTNYFHRSEIVKLGYILSIQTPNPLGSYYFLPRWDHDFFEVSEGSKGLSTGAVIGIAAAGAAVALLILALVFYAFKQKKIIAKAKKTSRSFGASLGLASGEYSGDALKLKGARWFSLEELKQATNKFSSENEIGSGGYGKVYKGMLAVGAQMVAIKRAGQESRQGGAEFKTEIELLSRVHHKNLVGLIGFCLEEGERILVYEYMPNGSVRDNLSARTGIQLDWRKRIWIALGSARGLTYLHDHANPPIIHRDVKSSNILLDEHLNAKVADFGISKLLAAIDTEAGGHITSQIKGTMGYLDPEYFMTQQLSQKSDVYSYGVVLLEILTARQPIERGKHLVREVKTEIERGGVNALRRHELLDPVLRDSPVSPTVFESFVCLALRCTEDAATDRPKMSDVVKELESIVESMGPNNQYDDTDMDAGRGVKTMGIAHPLVGGSSSDTFDYSGGYMMLPPIVEPK